MTRYHRRPCEGWYVRIGTSHVGTGALARPGGAKLRSFY
jgi:hypothetical protein